MTRNRHLARMLFKLAVPVAVLVAGVTTGTADRPQNGCTYGRYYVYYDTQGSICAESETCTNTGWGDCDDNETFASSEDYLHLCYCDPQ